MSGIKKGLGRVKKTNRGFEIMEFTDLYQCPCSLQQSSLANGQCLWLGTSDAQPKVMAVKAGSVGVQTTETTGWVSYPIPEDVLLSTRMHLNRRMVKALVHRLNRWLETGSFK